MAVIRSLDDWWTSCNTNWEHILDIFQKVGAPMGRDEEDRWWSDVYGEPSLRHDKCLAQTLEDLKSAKDGDALHSLFHKAWFAAPDKSYIHTWEGWTAFCDLISEDWVFEPERNPDTNVERHPSEGEAPDEAIWPAAHRGPA